MKEAEDFESKIFTEEIQMANEISNRYIADPLSHQILINKKPKKKI